VVPFVLTVTIKKQGKLTQKEVLVTEKKTIILDLVILLVVVLMMILGDLGMLVKKWVFEIY